MREVVNFNIVPLVRVIFGSRFTFLWVTKLVDKSQFRAGKKRHGSFVLILRNSQKPAALAKAWQNRRMAAWLRRAAPADGSGELARAPDEGESFFQRMMGKRKAEASPHVSPDKGAAPEPERVDDAASYLESLAVGTSSDACGDSSGSSSSGAKPEAHGMTGAKNRVGTAAECWAKKIDKDQIFEEIKAGCREDCKCVYLSDSVGPSE